MFVEVLTPDKTLFSGDAEVILDNHAPMIANLKSGNVEIKSSTQTETYEVKSGLVEVLKNKVVVLV